MRVLFLNELSDPRIGSSVRQMYQHAERLRELGHETAVVTCTQDAQRAAPGAVAEEEILGTRVFVIHSDYPLRLRAWVSLDNPRVREPLRKVLDAFRPDVAHSHLLHTHLGYASLTAAREAGAAVVFTAHDVMSFCYQKLTCFHGGEAAGGTLRDYPAHWSKCIPCQRLRFRPGRNRRIRKVLERDVHQLTTVSEELATALRANRIHVDRVVWNAVREQPRLPSADEVASFRAKHGLTGKQVVGIGGRLHEAKGVGKLLEMLALLARDLPDVRLVVMGRREVYDTEFADRARALGVHELVVPTGWLDGDELQQAYGAMDVLVTPSTCFDTFGLVNLEAMEHGKPVVATTFGGSREVVVDGLTGAIRNPFDVPAFAERIRHYLTDPEAARAAGEAGRRRLVEHFTIDRLAAEFLEVYEAALARRGHVAGPSRAG
ncbi:MAG: glycosyltransferase family 4 protein [Planctomycetota bacterium]